MKKPEKLTLYISTCPKISQCRVYNFVVYPLVGNIYYLAGNPPWIQHFWPCFLPRNMYLPLVSWLLDLLIFFNINFCIGLVQSMRFELQQPLWLNSIPATAVLLYSGGKRHKSIAELSKQTKETIWLRKKEIYIYIYIYCITTGSR